MAAKISYWDPKGEEKLSSSLGRLGPHSDARPMKIFLLLNASVNALRRLDPHFEARIKLKLSGFFLGSRLDDTIPIGNSAACGKGSHLVAPDPIRICDVLDFPHGHRVRYRHDQEPAPGQRYLSDIFYLALDTFRKADWTSKLLVKDRQAFYGDLKAGGSGLARDNLGLLSRFPKCIPPRSFSIIL